MVIVAATGTEGYDRRPELTDDGGGDLAELIRQLGSRSYTGWYILEQDVMLASTPAGQGPITDVRRSLDYLGTLGRRSSVA